MLLSALGCSYLCLLRIYRSLDKSLRHILTLFRITNFRRVEFQEGNLVSSLCKIAFAIIIQTNVLL